MKHVFVLLLVVVMLLSACGQKGPLFLPGHAPESQTEGAFGLNDDGEQDDENAEPERQVPDI